MRCAHELGRTEARPAARTNAFAREDQVGVIEVPGAQPAILRDRVEAVVGSVGREVLHVA
jgi:hypothetical protein